MAFSADILNAIDRVSGLGIDPQEKEAIALTEEIIRFEAEQPGGGSLKDALPALKVYRYHQTHPWVIPTLGALALVGALSAAYWIGKRAL